MGKFETLGILEFVNVNVLPGHQDAKFCVRDNHGITVDVLYGITMRFYGGTVSREITDNEVKIIIKK